MDYSTVPQDVLNYYGRDGRQGTGRYTDANGYQWIPQFEGQTNAGASQDANAGYLAGWRRGGIANELNSPFRDGATNLFYSPEGKYTHTDVLDKGWLTPATGLLAVASLGLGAGALAGGMEAGVGAGAAGVGDAAGMSGSGAFLGSGAASGVGAWDSALAGAGAAGAGTTGAGSLFGNGTGSGSMFGNSGGNSFWNTVAQKAGSMGLSQLMKGGGGGSSGGGQNMFGGDGSGYGSLRDWIGLAGGANDAYQQGKAANTMIDWLRANQAKMEGYMQPNSPEYNALWDQMERKDAQAGRLSQYGPRTQDFMANVAKARADNILRYTTGTSRGLAEALNQNAGRYAGLSAAAQRAAGGSPWNLSSILNQMGTGGNSGSAASVVDQIYGNGGAPIDYGAGMADPTEADVWDYIDTHGWE